MAEREVYFGTVGPFIYNDSVDGPIRVTHANIGDLLFADGSGFFQPGTIVYVGGRLWVTDTVQTTNATVTTIATVPIANNKSDRMEIGAVGTKDDYSEKAGFKIIALYTNNGGTVTLKGQIRPFRFRSNAWNVTLATSGTNVLIQVKREAAVTVNCKSNYTLLGV